MNGKICVVLAILFMSGCAFASIDITPSSIPLSQMYGGESYSTILHVTNNFDSAIYALLFMNVKNTSNDYTGFSAGVSDNNFFMHAHETRDINFVVSLVPNILPEDYKIDVWASTEYPENVVYTSGGGGGTSYRDKNIYIDKNIPLVVNNDGDIVYRDRNIYVDKVVEVPKYVDSNKQIPVWQPDMVLEKMVVLAIAFMVIGFAAGIILKSKGGNGNGNSRNNKEKQEGNNRNSPGGSSDQLAGVRGGSDVSFEHSISDGDNL